MEINDLDALTISFFLNSKITNIEILHLGKNFLTSEGLIYILTALNLHTNLKEVYLGSNYFKLWLKFTFYNCNISGNNPLNEIGINAFIDSLILFKNI